MRSELPRKDGRQSTEPVRLYPLRFRATPDAYSNRSDPFPTQSTATTHLRCQQTEKDRTQAHACCVPVPGALVHGARPRYDLAARQGLTSPSQVATWARCRWLAPLANPAAPWANHRCPADDATVPPDLRTRIRRTRSPRSRRATGDTSSKNRVVAGLITVEKPKVSAAHNLPFPENYVTYCPLVLQLDTTATLVLSTRSLDVRVGPHIVSDEMVEFGGQSAPRLEARPSGMMNDTRLRRAAA
jgi:hypothetical protein